MTFKSLPDLTFEQTVFATNIANGQVRSLYHEDIKGKDILFIAVGDSWTWGDSLYGISQQGPILDDPNRTNVIYGRLLANELGADFINCAKCGSSNLTMFNMLSRILYANNHKYKRIVVVVTLTENGREVFQLDSRKWMPTAKDAITFLRGYEEKMFKEFASLFLSYPDVKFIIARNFTHSFEENTGILKDYLVPNTWTEVLSKHQDCQPYPSDIRFLTGAAQKPLEDAFKSLNIEYKDQLIIEYEKGLQAIDWLENSKFNLKAGTKHPTIEGHELWAKYLLTFL